MNIAIGWGIAHADVTWAAVIQAEIVTRLEHVPKIPILSHNNVMSEPTIQEELRAKTCKSKEECPECDILNKAANELDRFTTELQSTKEKLAEVEKLIESEPELEGEIPDDMFALCATQQGATLVYRAVVRATKKNIIKRIRDNE